MRNEMTKENEFDLEKQLALKNIVKETAFAKQHIVFQKSIKSHDFIKFVAKMLALRHWPKYFCDFQC